MRRKLIKQDAFDQIEKSSATSAERELFEAEQILARALGKGPMALRCFSESTVVYETPDNTYVHAGYQVKDGNLTFNNIEELVIDENSRKEKQKKRLSEMIDAVLTDDSNKAQNLFQTYVGSIRWNEGSQSKKNRKIHESSRKTQLIEAVEQTIGKDIRDAYIVAQNVLGYVDVMRNGPTIAESISKKDDKNNITDLRIPTNEVRNQNRIQKFKWQTLNHENHGTRQTVPALVGNENFCKAIANLKRMNAFSDQEALVECLDHIVEQYPQVLYVTQSELSQILGEALQVLGVSNFDDKTCEFMAEGILRHAHDAYKEKVAQIMQMAGASPCNEDDDAYAHFANVAEQFFAGLDEQFGLQKRAFADLYESCELIFKKADRQGNEQLKKESATYLNELADILNGHVRPSLEAAESTAQWLSRLIESNVTGSSQSWSVSNTPHLTVSGDHPQMSKNATVPAIAGTHSGEWGDQAPAIGQDNHNYKGGKNAGEMRNRSWGQEGGGDVFPKLSNPYVPKPFGDYTMKPEKGVDKDNSNLGLFQSADVWPALQNPYVPKEAGGEGGKGHKMKDGKETDLIVDK